MNSLDFFSDHLQNYLDELQAFTAIETPTGDLANLERAAVFLTERLAPFGRPERCDLQDHGPLLRLRREGVGSRVLLLAHYDTVWPVGSWQNLWNVSHGRAHAPRTMSVQIPLAVRSPLWFAESVSNNAPVSSNEMAFAKLTPNIRTGLRASDSSSNSIVNWYW